MKFFYTYYFIIGLLFLNACSTKVPPIIERSLLGNNRNSSITIYYPVPDNFILKVHRVNISIDGEPYFFLKCGEHIKFFLEYGGHNIEVSDSDYFGYKETIEINVVEGQPVYLKTSPVFEGTRILSPLFPLPGPDITFKLFEVVENVAVKEILGKPVNATKRILP
jgi:hypothetical protein